MFVSKNKTTEERLMAAIRIIIWLLPFGLFIYLLNNYFVPSGHETVVYDVQEGSPLVRNFASKEPIKLIGTKNIPGASDYFQQITASPLYFDVKVPRPFRQATVTVQYQNPQGQPVIQLGVQQANQAYVFKPLADMSTTLESLPVYWKVIRDGDLYLWQKDITYFNALKAQQQNLRSQKKELDAWKAGELAAPNGLDRQQEINAQYQDKLKTITTENTATTIDTTGSVAFSSVQDFLDNVPQNNEVLQYQYEMNRHFQIPGYKQSTSVTEISTSMRGQQEIYTYLGDREDLQFALTIQDINRHADADPVNITVYDPDGNTVREIVVPDDGEALASGRVLPERIVDITAENSQPGRYRLVISTNDDMFIKKISTMQHLLMFIGHVYLADNQEYQSVLGAGQFSPTTLYATGSVIRASTSHEKNLQTLSVGSHNLTLDAVLTAEEINGLYGITTIESPKNDVYIEGNGFFAFKQSQLFDLSQTIVPSLDSIRNVDDYNYIIATYRPAKTEGDWLVASATVEAPQLYFDKGNDLLAHFILNMPGLHETGKTLQVKEITIQFQKDPITVTSIFNKIKSWIHRANSNP